VKKNTEAYLRNLAQIENLHLKLKKARFYRNVLIMSLFLLKKRFEFIIFQNVVPPFFEISIFFS